MSSRGTYPWLASMLVCGCGPLRIDLQLPAHQGMHAAILVLDDQERVRLFAADLDDGLVLAPAAAYEDGETVLLGLQLYRSSLAALRLGSGELVTVPAGDGRRLPRSDARYTARITAGGAEPWIDASSSAWPERWIQGTPEPAACPSFRPAFFVLDAPLRFAEQLSATEVLLGTVDGRFLIAGSGGATALPGPQTGEVHAAVNRQGVWLAGEGGQLWRGVRTSSLSLEQVSTSPRGERLRWLTSPDAPRAGELYALSSSGGVERYDGSGWSLLHRVCEPGECLGAGLLFPLGGEAVAFGDRGGSTLLRATPAGVSPSLTVPAGTEITNSAWIPAVGALVAIDDGPLLHFNPEQDRWSPMPGFDFDDRLSGIGAYQDGLAFGNKYGELGLWTPRVGLCSMRSIGASDVLQIFELAHGELLVVSGARSFGLTNDPVLIVLRPEL